MVLALAGSILGVERTVYRFRTWEQAFAQQMGRHIEARLRELQRDVVATARRDSGQMAAAFADAEALAFKRDSRGNIIKGRFGLLNNRLGRLGYYAFFVEFGTKGYQAGGVRYAGKYRSAVGGWFYIDPATFRGRPERFEQRTITNARGQERHQARRIDAARFETLRRTIPARPAHPFIRPAAVRFFEAMRRDRAVAKIAATAWAGTVLAANAATASAKRAA